jgi:ankyrin repeat protein
MNRESVACRTVEIKSNIINQMYDVPSMLCFYIKDCNYQKFKEIIDKHNSQVDSRDNNMNTLLNIAVQSDCLDIVQYLLNLNADVNLQNLELNTPLHYALGQKKFKIANLLIKHKADEELKNKKGLTPWQCYYMDTI